MRWRWVAVSLSAQRVASTGVAAAQTALSQSGLSTTGSGNGAIVLRTSAGALSVNQAVSANGSGRVLLQTLGAGTDLTLSADVGSGSGSISVLSAQALSLLANADVQTSSTSQGSGHIDLQALTTLTMDVSSSLVSTGATAVARLSASDVVVGRITLASGSVGITATGGSIIDADPLAGTANDFAVDITSYALRLNAAVGIGSAVDALETSVAAITARATSGGIHVLESDSLEAFVVHIMVARVDSAGAGSWVDDGEQFDVATTAGDGDIVMRTLAGALALSDYEGDGVSVSAHGSGNVLLQSQGAGSALYVKGDVLSGSGNISLLAQGELDVRVGADVRTSSTGAGSGSIDLESFTQAVTMSSTSVLASTGQTASARIKAALAVTVGDIELPDGAVSITAGAGISDADALVGSANDTDLDISAASVRLSAGTAMGASVNHLEISAGTLSARAAAGSIFLHETDALTVGSVAVSVNRVAVDTSTSTVTDAAQSDLVTTCCCRPQGRAAS